MTDPKVAPPVILSATHKKAIDGVSLQDLKDHAVDPLT
jgi:uncharacterized protein (DUF2237 family)